MARVRFRTCNLTQSARDLYHWATKAQWWTSEDRHFDCAWLNLFGQWELPLMNFRKTNKCAPSDLNPLSPDRLQDGKPSFANKQQSNELPVVNCGDSQQSQLYISPIFLELFPSCFAMYIQKKIRFYISLMYSRRKTIQTLHLLLQNKYYNVLCCNSRYFMYLPFNLNFINLI